MLEMESSQPLSPYSNQQQEPVQATSIAELLRTPPIQTNSAEGPPLMAMHSPMMLQMGPNSSAAPNVNGFIHPHNNNHLQKPFHPIRPQMKIEKTDPSEKPYHCARCAQRIVDKYLLKALDQYWHEDCLKCDCCHARLGEMGDKLYCKGEALLCHRDYLRVFGPRGICAACNKEIWAFEYVMRAKANVYHLPCFACQECNQPFCVGDRFFLCDNKILCENDFEERNIFASMYAMPGPQLAQLKRQLRHQLSEVDEAVQTPAMSAR